MGAIEGRVKLAICLRVLFGQFQMNPHPQCFLILQIGEPVKTLAQLFCVALRSATDSFDLYLDHLNECKMLNFGQEPTLEELQLRALQFSGRSSHPNVFQHCVEAIDGILVWQVCLRFLSFFSIHKTSDSYYVPQKRGRSKKFLLWTQE
jgi:hypothetical protein